MSTIILTGGGTAGHCVPHLAILPYIKNDFDKIYYIGSKNGIEKNIIEKENLPYYSVPCAKLKRKLCLDNLKIPFVVYSGIKKAQQILTKLKPDVIFSKGGFVAVPVVLAGAKLKIPIISHESDYTVGLANKLTSKLCKKVLTSFPETARTLKNGEYIGAPIRKELFNADKEKSLKYFGFNSDKPILLVTGGSQGSSTINNVLRQSLDILLTKFNVIHICGKNNLDKNINKTGYVQIEYLHNMEKAFSVASVCVSRAGSNTAFELINLKIPTVFIPLPKGLSRGDQVLNAQYFEKQGFACVLQQDLLTTTSFITAVNCAYLNRNVYKQNIENSNIRDSSRQISRMLADCINARF